MQRILSYRGGRSFYVIALLALCLSLATATWAEGRQDFTLNNNTGSPIFKLYISPHDVNDWQEDILGEGTLSDGDEVDITFDREEDAELWDMKIVFENDTDLVWTELKLTQITHITLHWDPEEDRTWAITKNGD